MTVVPKLWPGSTIACIATGPSLTQADVDQCRDRSRVIVVNDAYKLAPWADVLWACDAKWWNWHKGASTFSGLKYSLCADPKKYPDVQILKNLGRHGLSTDARGLKTGHDSGYQSINLAVLLGATKIVLLGYDMQAKGGDHFFGAHPDKTRPPFHLSLTDYRTLVAPLKQAGVSIVNCTQSTALRCFPRAPLETALLEQAA